MKPRSTDPELLKAHDEAWRAFKAHPIDIEIEKLHTRLIELETWNHHEENLEQHSARYEAGKPREIWARIKTLQLELYQTVESIRWFELYQRVNP